MYQTKSGHTSMTTPNYPSIHHEESFTLNTVTLIFLFKGKSPPLLPKTYLKYLDYITTALKIENSIFT